MCECGGFLSFPIYGFRLREAGTWVRGDQNASPGYSWLGDSGRRRPASLGLSFPAIEACLAPSEAGSEGAWFAPSVHQRPAESSRFAVGISRRPLLSSH